MVAVIRGANAPLLTKTVIDELKKEHQVLKGEADRVEIRDPLFAHLESEKSTMDEFENEKSDESKSFALLQHKVGQAKDGFVRLSRVVCSPTL